MRTGESELLGLKWDWIDGGIIHLRKTKTLKDEIAAVQEIVMQRI